MITLEEEIEFLGRILHLPFFEFCLQVKERKQRLEKELEEEKAKMKGE